VVPPDDAFLVDDGSPAGDGVRVAGLLVAVAALVTGVGVNVAGTDVPPRVQAETVAASRTAPAAERPANGHAPPAVTGGVRRIFMNPPRMRVR
jgi:hypothetical protein